MRPLSPLDQFVLRTIAKTERTRKWPVWICYVIVAALIIAIEVIRVFWLGGLPKDLPHSPYLPFLPVVILSALIFDRHSGIFATVFLSLVATATKGPVANSAALKIDVTQTLVLWFFGITAAIAIESLNHLFDRHRIAGERNEILIRDVNHRVKNHLAAIAGLVNMARKDLDQKSQDVLDTIAARLTVLARLYDRLRLDTDNGAVHVELNDFIPAICSDLGHSIVGSRPIDVHVDVTPLTITADKAVPIGLLVNELMTNSLKHAFPNGAGIIDVRFRHIDDGYELEVADDGIGGEMNSTGTGSRLINMLVRQLHGTLTVDNRHGRQSTIRLPASLLSQPRPMAVSTVPKPASKNQAPILA